MARSTSFRKFPVGAKVRAWMTGVDHRGGDCVEGTVVEYMEDILHVTVVKPSSSFRSYIIGSRCPVWADTAELLITFDPDKPVEKTRAGYPVSEFNSKRMQAVVEVPGKGAMRLSFDSHGMFYKGHESPVDLVNVG